MKFKELSIRFWIVLFINILVVLTVLVLSVFFYQEFQQTLDQRVLLQLTSIKSLKNVQIEEYLQREWETFVQSADTLSPVPGRFTFQEDTFFFTRTIDTLNFLGKKATNVTNSGIYDITPHTEDKTIQLAMITPLDSGYFLVKQFHPDRIQAILLERTGMGNSGETYLVGADSRLRSVSRFFPDQSPYSITANTLGVQEALAGQAGTDIIEDYRGIPVYSAYDALDIRGLRWAILSEMDVAEVVAPLQSMKRKLILISLMVLFFALIISFLLTDVVSRPVLKMRERLMSMARGNYDIDVQETSPAREMNEMFLALEALKNSIQGAIRFSRRIGDMHLDASYELSGQNDALGKSLLAMREQLIAFNKREQQNRLTAKQSLITGQENERNRLARELHDGLGPLLTSLKLLVQSPKIGDDEKKQIKNMVDETIDEIRRMTYNLMPPSLIDFGVGKALVSLVNMVRKSGDINIDYIDETKDHGSNMDTDIHICLYRVTQELINNTLKHANAHTVRLSITEFDDKVSLYYRDDGRGFDPETVDRGAGLRNMKERIEVFNGYLSIHSNGSGTEVEVELPLGV
ncbi:MAG: histidine kinase [Cyclobacteriaceae bacterium]